MNFKFRWSTLLAAGVFIERCHSGLQSVSPIYSDFVRDTTNKLKRKLRLASTVEDEIIRHIGTEQIDVSFRDLPSASHEHPFSEILMDEIEKGDLFLDFGIRQLSDTREAIRKSSSSIQEILNAFSDQTVNRKDVVKKELWWFGKQSSYWVPYDYLPAKKKWLQPMNHVLFLKYKGQPFVLLADWNYNTGQIDITTFDSAKNCKQIMKYINSLINRVNKFNPFKKCVVRFYEANLPEEDKDTPKIEAEPSIRVYPAESETIKLRYKTKKYNRSLYSVDIQRLIEEDVPNFIKCQTSLCKKGFDGRRSYMLVGPPGTGKSGIISAIVARLPEDYTVVLVGPEDIKLLQSVNFHVYLSPVVFLIEDIDLILENTKEKQHLLNFLDGMTSPDKMLTIMTCNSPQLLDPALINRPGRVDKICVVTSGDVEQRASQVAALTKKITLPCPAEDVAQKTDGLSFAQHREVIRRALIYSDSADSITEDALKKSIDECLIQYKNDPRKLVFNA